MWEERMYGIAYINVLKSDLDRRYVVLQMCDMPNMICGVWMKQHALKPRTDAGF